MSSVSKFLRRSFSFGKKAHPITEKDDQHLVNIDESQIEEANKLAREFIETEAKWANNMVLKTGQGDMLGRRQLFTEKIQHIGGAKNVSWLATVSLNRLCFSEDVEVVKFWCNIYIGEVILTLRRNAVKVAGTSAEKRLAWQITECLTYESQEFEDPRLDSMLHEHIGSCVNPKECGHIFTFEAPLEKD